ncbi:MAG TPA: UDP-N-acetylglucosamine--N-acetylmuramyl-(pentapeptide) pyrophosphoryl-undecaprenol N-acetylglucosamine transferase [Acholeplasmataceae bacterium]|nr:UDP-N-acetylglucosamine--N-acetylmuramyl-(pentapeptide) pyrophosphoryl-undecaprenol N-acetylglucosamine transferase [Acholeplasmataceae bacterium]
MKKIIIVGGGTLGHIYPILPVVNKIKDKYKLYFIGTKTGLERRLIESNPDFIKKFFLDMQGFKRKLSLYNLVTISKFIKCYKNSKKILREIKPDLVIGMGGYISGVVIKVAKKMKFKAIIHEQNSVLGLANKFVEKNVDAVLLNFPLKRKLKNTNVKLVGNPRLTEIFENNKIKNELKKYLVVVGGSRGSKVINDTIISMIPELIKNKYKVVLITGSKYYEENENKIKVLNYDDIKIIPFTNELISYLKKASVIISRSGATTLAEIIALRKIAILIPSPNVTNNHQEENANILVKQNCAVKILEKNLSKEKLLDMILNLEENNSLRSEFIYNMMKSFNYHARDDFINEMEKFL